MRKKGLEKVKRKISILLILVMLSAVMLPASKVSAAATAENTVYSFLTGELGLNSAAACGIMANIMTESSFIPTNSVIDTNDLTSYGLFMWNGGRFEALKTWCKNNGYAYDTVEGQMRYFKYELENTEKASYTAMKNIPNTDEGCVTAAMEFARLFERCAKYGYALRAVYAINNYWPAYGNGTASGTRGIYGMYCNYPGNIKTGGYYSLYGSVVSYVSPIKSVTAGVYDAAGNLLTGYTAYPNKNAYYIPNLDRYVSFNILSNGTYYYRITAQNSDGMYEVEAHSFTVSSSATYPEGKKGYFSEITAGTVQCGFGTYCPGGRFSDMPSATNWAHEGIDFAVSQNLFQGTSSTKFEPNTSMSRAMLVTVLYRLEGEPSVSGMTNKFSDVADGKFYTNAVIWASSNNIVKGKSETEFAPYENITREQMATMLQRYTEVRGLDSLHRADISSFPDASDASSFAVDGLAWAIGAGIMEGKRQGDVTILEPKGSATRAQVATMLMRFSQNVLN